MKKKPVIGITLDWEDKPTYSDMNPWYALRTNYTSAISAANGVPITIPYDHKAIEQYIDIIDGLMIPGGDHDLNPTVYGEELEEKTRAIKDHRSIFEMALIKAALAKNIPILAICAGKQLLAAIYGGKLIQDIKSFSLECLEHEQKKLGIHMSKAHHSIKIIANSLLHDIIQQDEIEVNSSHHQAVKSIGPEMIVSAIAPDGIIEAVEVPARDFVLGVEWHPEYIVSNSYLLIMKAFVAASAKKRGYNDQSI